MDDEKKITIRVGKAELFAMFKSLANTATQNPSPQGVTARDAILMGKLSEKLFEIYQSEF